MYDERDDDTLEPEAEHACEGCGHEFAGDEWEDAHDHSDGYLYHEECCPYCNPEQEGEG